jgi:hypothetical protein
MRLSVEGIFKESMESLDEVIERVARQVTSSEVEEVARYIYRDAAGTGDVS